MVGELNWALFFVVRGKVEESGNNDFGSQIVDHTRSLPFRSKKLI